MIFARLSEIGELQASSAIDRSHRVSPLPGQHLGTAPVDRDLTGGERPQHRSERRSVRCYPSDGREGREQGVGILLGSRRATVHAGNSRKGHWYPSLDQIPSLKKSKNTPA
jgi:hypothetical protein